MSYYQNCSATLIPDLEGRTIDAGRLRLTKVLGKGAWGVVYLAETTDLSVEKQYYAVKCIISSGVSTGDRETICHEVRMHSVCSKASPDVLKLHCVIESMAENLIFIVTEYCPDGDLLEAVLAGKFVGENELCKQVFLQILDAVEACHNVNIYHRDLKPENILCKDGGKRVVLADFGFASPEKLCKDFRTGSEPFMSPEVRGGLYLPESRYSTAQADVWALGVILMNLACGCLPWEKASLNDRGFRYFLLSDRDYLLHYFQISRDLNDVLKCIFTTDPRKRITIPDLRKRISAMTRFGLAQRVARLPNSPLSRAASELADTVHKVSENVSVTQDVFVDQESEITLVPVVAHKDTSKVRGHVSIVKNVSAGQDTPVTHATPVVHAVPVAHKLYDGDQDSYEDGPVDMHIENGVVTVLIAHPAEEGPSGAPPLSALITADFARDHNTSTASTIGPVLDDNTRPRHRTISDLSGTSSEFVNGGRASTILPDISGLDMDEAGHSDSASSSDEDDDESEGPITPEQFAVDAVGGDAAMLLEDVPELADAQVRTLPEDLLELADARVSGMGLAKALVALHQPAPKNALGGDSDKKPAGDFDDRAPGSNATVPRSPRQMLRSAAKRVGRVVKAIK